MNFFKKVESYLRSHFVANYVQLRHSAHKFVPSQPRPHELSGELIVSLTSFAARFSTLHLTIQCFLAQSVKPDRVILWLSPKDKALLPPEVLALQKDGLEVRTCDDIGPYTKIIPALRAFPDAFIVTADDDTYYSVNWLRDLIKEWDKDYAQIVCHRAHKIKTDIHGAFLPYTQWEFEIAGPQQSTQIFPTGVGGVLYPPGSFSPEVLDKSLFLRLAPKADDVWLYWMGRRNDVIYKKTPINDKLVYWRGSQKVGLLYENVIANANDPKIKAMAEHFGWPDATPASHTSLPAKRA